MIMAREKTKRNKEIYDKYTGIFSKDGRLYTQRELAREYGFKSQKSIFNIIQREEARRSTNNVLVLHGRNIKNVVKNLRGLAERKSCTT